MNALFRRIFLLVGLRANEMPTEAEGSVLMDFVLRHYGNHSHQEVLMAFEMAIAGKLEIKPEDVKTYGSFSTAYFASIMNAFRSWAGKTVAILEREVNPPPAQLQAPALEIDEIMDWLDETHALVRAGKLATKLLPIALYNFVTNLGIPVVTLKRKKEIHLECLIAVRAEFAEARRKDPIDKAVSIRCKQIALQEYLINTPQERLGARFFDPTPEKPTPPPPGSF